MDKRVLLKIRDEYRESSGKVHYFFLDSINDISKFDLECTDWDGSDCSSYYIVVNDKHKVCYDNRKRRDEVFEELMMAISEKFDVVTVDSRRIPTTRREAIWILKNFVSEMTDALQDENKENHQYAPEVFWKNKDFLESIIAMLEGQKRNG